MLNSTNGFKLVHEPLSKHLSAAYSPHSASHLHAAQYAITTTNNDIFWTS